MTRLAQVNRVVSSYDTRLFAVLSSDGVIHVLREGAKPGDSDYKVENTSGRPHPQFIFALTDTWQLGGVPVERGLEQIHQRLAAMDTWSKYERADDRLHEMHKLREQEKEQREREASNNNKAMAMELRRDFAKASNDFVVPAGNRDTTRVFTK